MKIQLKICGLQPDDDVSFARDECISYIGFIFVPQSKRYIRPEAAAMVTQVLPGTTKAIGVFVDASLDEILHVVDTAHIHGVQLHGRESSEMCAALKGHGLIVWKAFSVEQGTEVVETLVNRMKHYTDCVDAVLLDTAPPKSAANRVTGGHGKAFDWSVLPTLSERLKEHHPELSIWIAGGITPENTSTLIHTWRPSGIDISSGVELHGRKSLDLINQLLSVVKSYV